MPVSVTRIDNKFKSTVVKRVKQQAEFAVMMKEHTVEAMDKFKEEPYQLKYMRTYGTNRTKQQSKKNIDEK